MSNLYSQMIEQMNKCAYTSVKAQETINAFLAQQQISAEEYEALMEKAKALDVNPGDAEMTLRVAALEETVTLLKKEVAAIKEAVSSGSTEVPEPDPGQTGAEMDPIDAVRGMTYYKDKYYRDPDDGQVYQCCRDSDTEPGTGVALAYLPHELVDIYFCLLE